MQTHRNKDRWHGSNSKMNQKQQATNKQYKQTMQQENVCMDSSNSRQWKKFDNVCCYVHKNVENSEMFAEDFIQHRYYGSIFTSLFLRSL